MDDRRGLARSAGLLVVAFVATLILLGGLWVGLGGQARPIAEATATPTLPIESEPVASVDASASPGASPVSQEPRSVAPSPSGDPVIVGAGDIASCGLDGDEATAELLDGIAGTVFTAGDNAYEDGSDENYAECYEPTWGRHKSRTKPVPGNHDYQTKDAAGYRKYFGAAALNEDGDTWYSFDLGTWHVVMLDSNCGAIGGCAADSPEGTWLAADLAANPTTCTLAIWHHPRFSSGDEHGNDPRTDPFWRLLYAAGADVIVNGHDHDYERFAPQNPDGKEDRAKGIREFVAGTGGASLRGFNPPVANSELRVAVTPGVLELTLHPSGYDWNWIPTSGLVSDKGSGPCH
jgi:hypothetical protein